MRLAGVFVVGFVAGCTHDFDAFLPAPNDAASFDGTIHDALPDSGGVDSIADTGVRDTSGCADASVACLATAKSCGATCRTTRESCEASCGNPGCKNKCRDAETSCKASCTTTCTSCTRDVGCEDPARCASEVASG